MMSHTAAVARFGGGDHTMSKKPSMTKDAAMMKRRGRPLQEVQDPDARSGINHPGMNDVMFGRGGDTNYHIGNNSFRHLVESFSDRYWAATNRKEKSTIIGLIISGWRTQDPPGRFLAKTDPAKGDDSLWHDVGDQVAGRKASKILSEMRIGKRNKAAKAGAKRAAAAAAASKNPVGSKTPLAANSSGSTTAATGTLNLEQANRKRKAREISGSNAFDLPHLQKSARISVPQHYSNATVLPPSLSTSASLREEVPSSSTTNTSTTAEWPASSGKGSLLGARQEKTAAWNAFSPTSAMVDLSDVGALIGEPGSNTAQEDLFAPLGAAAAAPLPAKDQARRHRASKHMLAHSVPVAAELVCVFEEPENAKGVVQQLLGNAHDDEAEQLMELIGA